MKPIIAITVDAETRQDHEKLGIALAKLAQEDPTFHIQTQPPAGMFVISGMSELHLEKIIEYLTEKCEAQLVIGEPKVVYLETIRANGEAEGKYIRQMGPKGNYGHVKIRVAPNEYSKGYEFSNDTRDGSISSEYIPAIDQGLQEAMQGGVLVGYEMVDIKVSLFDGTYHEIDSNEMAFKIAASMAFKEAARKAKPVLLEPVMDVEVTISEEYMGTIIGDLNSRSGRIEGMEMVGRMQSIKATVPLRTMLGYATHLRSLAQGRANCSMQFKQYEEAPRPLGGHWSA